ncbi:MAG: hypothetical protein ACP5I1_10385, partial [Candidatus Hinthialibacter sp.]
MKALKEKAVALDAVGAFWFHVISEGGEVIDIFEFNDFLEGGAYSWKVGFTERMDVEPFSRYM